MCLGRSLFAFLVKSFCRKHMFFGIMKTLRSYIFRMIFFLKGMIKIGISEAADWNLGRKIIEDQKPQWLVRCSSSWITLNYSNCICFYSLICAGITTGISRLKVICAGISGISDIQQFSGITYNVNFRNFMWRLYVKELHIILE